MEGSLVFSAYRIRMEWRMLCIAEKLESDDGDEGEEEEEGGFIYKLLLRCE